MTLTTFAASAFATEEAQAPDEQLWERRDLGHPSAFREIAFRYAPFAREVLRCFVRDRPVPPRIEFDELLSAANAGLIRAIARYDQHSGFEFTTFAFRRIRGAVMDEIRGRNKVPRSLHESRARTHARFEADPTEEARQALSQVEMQVAAVDPLSICEPAGDSVSMTIGDLIPAPENPDGWIPPEELHEAMKLVLATRTDRDRLLLTVPSAAPLERGLRGTAHRHLPSSRARRTGEGGAPVL